MCGLYFISFIMLSFIFIYNTFFLHFKDKHIAFQSVLLKKLLLIFDMFGGTSSNLG
jgi:uncharacterized membrane protein